MLARYKEPCAVAESVSLIAMLAEIYRRVVRVHLVSRWAPLVLTTNALLRNRESLWNRWNLWNLHLSTLYVVVPTNMGRLNIYLYLSTLYVRTFPINMGRLNIYFISRVLR